MIEEETGRLEAVGRLAAGVAHDFNNLLTIVLGAAETFIERHGDEPTVLALAEVIRASGERGAELAAHLLAFARGRPVTAGLVDVGALLARMEPLLRRAVGKGAELAITCPPGLLALAEAAQLEAAVLNLAINARDAMPAGGRLVIEAARDGGQLVVTVTDTGEGMAPGVAERAFEPFFTTKGEGTGLGLAMVEDFARRNGGRAALRSWPGEGTSVSLILPSAG